jgi:hypothetical protein
MQHRMMRYWVSFALMTPSETVVVALYRQQPTLFGRGSAAHTTDDAMTVISRSDHWQAWWWHAESNQSNPSEATCA